MLRVFHEHRPHIVLSMSTRQLTVAIALSGKGWGDLLVARSRRSATDSVKEFQKKKLLVSADCVGSSDEQLMN